MPKLRKDAKDVETFAGNARKDFEKNFRKKRHLKRKLARTAIKR